MATYDEGVVLTYDVLSLKIGVTDGNKGQDQVVSNAKDLGGVDSFRWQIAKKMQ
jgi:hypothetical protein